MTPKDWLKARLTGEAARREWAQVVAASWDPLLQRKVRELVDPEKLQRWQAASSEEGPRWAEAASRVLREQVEQARSRTDRPTEGLPGAAKTAFVDIFRDAPVPPEWVRQWFSTSVAEMLVADTLYKSLQDFSSAIPNLVQSLLPGFLGRFSKLGGGRLSSLIEEVERRLDPEVRRFVEAGSRRALERAGEYAVRHLDDPATLEARAAFARYMWQEPWSRWVTPMSDPVLAHVFRLLEALGQDAAEGGPLWGAVREATDRFFSEWGDRPVGELLARWQMAEPPPLEAWADLAWPPLVALLETPEADAWLERVAEEFRDFLRQNDPA